MHIQRLKQQFFSVWSQRNHNFYYRAAILMTPAILYAFLENLNNFIDSFVIGAYMNEAAIVGVALVGTLITIIFFLVNSISLAAGVFNAQYLGQLNVPKIKETVRVRILIAVPLMALIAVLLFCLATPILKGLLTTRTSTAVSEAEALAYGRDYLQYVIWSIPLFAFSFCMSMTANLHGHTKVPFFMAFLSTLLNGILDPLLILGVGVLPEMGVIGAAVATLAVRVFQAIILILYFVIKKPFFAPGWKIWVVSKQVWVQILKQLPLIMISQTLYGAAFSVQLIFFMKLGGADLTAAASAAFTILNLFFSAFMGYIALIGYYIGRFLGNNELEQARINSHRIMILIGVFSLILGTIYMSTSFWLIDLIYGHSFSPKALVLAKWLIQFQSIAYVAGSLALGFVEIVRAGNYQIPVLLFESTFYWIFGVAGLVVLYQFNLSDKWILAILSLLETIQVPITFLMYKYIKWNRRVIPMLANPDPNLKLDDSEPVPVATQVKSQSAPAET